jgi:branched-chain amino acid transport system ATP-binding protein
MNDVLVLQQVSAGYGDAVVISKIDLRLQAGESLAVLGRNGPARPPCSTPSSA